MNNHAKKNVLVAEVLTDPQEMFVLWAIHKGIYTSPKDFIAQYGKSLPLRSLQKKGFIRRTWNRLSLTPLGVEAMIQFGESPESTPSTEEPHERFLDYLISYPSDLYQRSRKYPELIILNFVVIYTPLIIQYLFDLSPPLSDSGGSRHWLAILTFGMMLLEVISIPYIISRFNLSNFKPITIFYRFILPCYFSFFLLYYAYMPICLLISR